MIGELRDVINQTVLAHKEADSLRFKYERLYPLKLENDSLRAVNTLLRQELMLNQNIKKPSG